MKGKGSSRLTAADPQSVAEADRRLARWAKLAALYMFVIVVPLASALAVRIWLDRRHDDPLAPRLPSERATAIAWAKTGPNLLFIGLASGRIAEITPGQGGYVVTSPDPKRGPIVDLYPKPGRQEAVAAYLSPESDLSYLVEGQDSGAGLAGVLDDYIVTDAGPEVPTRNAYATKASSDASIVIRDSSSSSGSLVPLGQIGQITTISAAADAVAIGSLPGGVTGIDLPTGKETIDDIKSRLRSNVYSHPAPVAAIVFSSSGAKPRRLVSVGTDGSVYYYDEETRKAVPFDIRGGDTVNTPAFDGLQLSSEGRTVLLREQTGGILAAPLPQKSDLFAAPNRLRHQIIPALLPKANLNLEVQTKLRDRGFDPGPPDGVLGARTREALSAFKAKFGITQDSDTAVMNMLAGSLRTSAAALSPQGDWYALAGNDGLIYIAAFQLDRDGTLMTGDTYTIRGHGDVITRLSISPDAKYLASLDVGGRVWITDLAFARALFHWPLARLASDPDPEEMTSVPLDMETNPPAVSAASSYMVVFGADRTEEAARDELQRARQAGFPNVRIIHRDGWYRSVALFDGAEQQAQALPGLRTLSVNSSGAYPRRLADWCASPQTIDKGDGVVECATAPATSSAPNANSSSPQQQPIPQPQAPLTGAANPGSDNARPPQQQTVPAQSQAVPPAKGPRKSSPKAAQ